MASRRCQSKARALVFREKAAWIVAVTAAMLATILLAMPAAAATATKATDVCGANDDPCNVTQTYDIPAGVCSDNPIATCSSNAECAGAATCKLGITLDFGTRDVVVSGAGQFNFGASSGSILTGGFTATTSAAAIDAAEGGSSGSVRVYARRKCSIGGANAFACLSNAECQLGTCSVRRCTGLSTKVCGQDQDCKVGTCNEDKKCTGLTSIRCTSNTDCDLGTCPAQLTCTGRPTEPLNCTTNSDCQFGTCSTGTASITMNGAIAGNSGSPAYIDLRASDNVVISEPINLAGTTADSDGGELSVDTAFGNITIADNVTATGGGFSGGGFVTLYAAGDVNVNAQIDVTGGDFDGGEVDFDAGRDLIITRSIFANSGAGAGSGGSLTMLAGRDLTVSGNPTNKTALEANGHANLFNEAGFGGDHDYTSDRHMTLNVNTRVQANGASPDGSGGDISLDASGNLTHNGDVIARGTGVAGEGGIVTFYAQGTATTGLSGTIDVTGGSDGGGGDLDLFSEGDLTFGGLADLGGSNGGDGGIAALGSFSNASVSGTVRIASGDDGNMTVDACRVTLTSTGKLDAGLTATDNLIRANETIRLNTGSLMKAGAAGSNRFIYRSAAKPPVVNGTVSPAPILEVNPLLAGCPVCGNNELDGGETCEDGNTVNGDGCNSQCQNEKCVQQTAAKVACSNNNDCTGGKQCDGEFCTPWGLCEDGDGCTTDTCNTALAGGTCVHAPKNCSDSKSCTVDTCDPDNALCNHEPDNDLCDDGNECTDDTCSPTTGAALTGCVITSNSNPCEDGNECTEGDTCVSDECTGTPIQGCGFCGDGEVTGAEVCDDGDAVFQPGQYCGVDCAVLTPCGKPTGGTGAPKTSDAQFALRAAVGTVTCSRRVCDVDNSTKIVTSDAQRILRKAVGQNVTLNCPTTGS